jgi:type IV pilus assembly protein PilY1
MATQHLNRPLLGQEPTALRAHSIGPMQRVQRLWSRLKAFTPAVLAALVLNTLSAPAHAGAALADQPIFASEGVPGNLALALSAEYPTVVGATHTDASYITTKTYIGYFDSNKCYLYNYNVTESLRYFYPAGDATARSCTGTNDAKWSGNFLNFATMQTIDPFRQALTGGYRSTDTTTLTLLEKAWASGQGGSSSFPNRSITTSAIVTANTPFTWSRLDLRIYGRGNALRFTSTGNIETTSATVVYDPAVAVVATTVYELTVRVKVCDPNTATAGPMESNCTAYGAGTSTVYKPTGLVQQYADKIRYSMFGYLNDNNLQRDGAVLRARQKFVGPVYTLPGSATVANVDKEWDPLTGIFITNPDAADALTTQTATGVAVTNSGFINYLNKFGQITRGDFKSYDPVGELYYAALRYYRGLGNVSEWSNMGSASLSTKTTWVDSFPVITNWVDPILYACQKNFVLGIGDINAWADRNVPGSHATTASEPSKPASVTSDTSVNALTATNKVGVLHGLGASLGTTMISTSRNNGYLMAGLAFDANGKDIRPDDATKPHTKGKQTVQTYWLDVLEGGYQTDNVYYLTAKYGGAKLPEDFDPYTRTTDLPLAWWNTPGETYGGQNKPSNYFVASKADEMVAGLNSAFASIASNLAAYTTSFSTALPQVTTTGTASFSAKYDAGSWTGDMAASSSVFDPLTGVPTNTVVWRFTDKLAVQAAGTGWDTGRRIVTFNTASNAGVPFRSASISAAQLAALDTPYRTGVDGPDYLNYLRGQRLHEQGQTDPLSTETYRKRTGLFGDVVGSKPRVVGQPQADYSSVSNPGYGTFKNTWKDRKTMVYVASNGGMLHAVDGSITAASGGTEVFAYVPGGLFAGPTGTPATNGLASRGNPTFAHRYLVDATPTIVDIDLGRTVGGSGTDWRTLLVGGLGKGGKSYYAIDVTDPSTMTTEAAVAGKVLWEFSHADMGYSYGEPAAMRTTKYGWVLVFGSGYNNADGKGYIFIVNPRTGALLEKIGTGVGDTTNEAGLAHVQGFSPIFSDFLADSVYAGDLMGNVWRFDLRGSVAYPAPLLLATLKDASNVARPITQRPMVVSQPGTDTRWVTVGTGRLLHTTDVSSSQVQAMYAIKDGTSKVFYETAPAGFTFPITNNQLKLLTDLTITNTINPTSQLGWVVELGATGGKGWRVVSDSTAFYGTVEFTTMLPTGDTCNPTGSSRVYVIDLGLAQSTVLVAGSDVNVTAYSELLKGVATEQRTYAITNEASPNATNQRFYACSSGGDCVVIKTKPRTGGGWRRMNWRELPLAN